MLKSNDLSINWTIGMKPIPSGMEVIGSTGVVDTTNGNSGLLVKVNATGLYAIYSGLGILCSVDQRAAKAYASTKV